MNILYLSLGKEYGGTEKVVENLVDGFIDNKITIGVLKGTRFSEKLAFKYRDNVNVRIFEFSDKSILKKVFLLRKLIKNEKFDFIHIHSITSNFIFQLANISLKNKSIVTVHSRADLDRKSFLKNYLMKKLELKLLTKNDMIICVSNSIKEYLLKQGLKKNIKVIHNGIDNKRNKVNINRKNEFKSLYFYEKDFFVLFIGRLTEVKGVYNLVNIIKMMSNKNKNVKFLVVGDGELKGYIEEEILKKKLKNIKLLGFIDNIFEILPNCDLLLMPSNMEGIPITLLEAMSCKVPCIASNVGGIPEIINNENGILCEKSDVEDFVNKIDCFEKNRLLLDKYKENTYKNFKENWCIDKFLEKYKESYFLL
ncbi:glycosyltransferase family 4 protein [Clostridium perfringens]|nr:glycosyltransferase family 4 protein [Clostridium perfringens]